MKKTLVIMMLMTLAGTSMASADTLSGVPTLNGSTAPVFIGDPIEFYIPLADDTGGVYGDGGIGMSPDSAHVQFNGDLLDMYLYFAIPTDHIGTSLTLSFDDLDLSNGNDPQHFFEKITLYGEYDLPSGTFLDINDLNALADVSATYQDPGINNSVEIVFSDLSIMSGGGDFWWHIGLEAYSENLGGTYWTNTVEKLSVQMETAPVPEPATIILFGAGLAALSGTFLRKKEKY